ncbi:MAG TPA: hypothetical protein VFS40_07050 [Gemmatimonadales bacterium]|nr:hypothetical protein [Gemmatimonadales bacterium]
MVQRLSPSPSVRGGRLRAAVLRAAVLRAAVLGAAVLGAACGGASFPSDSAAVAPSDVPAAFVRDTAAAPPAGADTAVVTGPPLCHTPMIDPRDGTRLRLVESLAGRGDYLVPMPNRYGAGPEQFLRLECASGRVIGLVPRAGRKAHP